MKEGNDIPMKLIEKAHVPSPVINLLAASTSSTRRKIVGILNFEQLGGGLSRE